mmetsp:Transcript_111103/g.346228  ORF Transcript_111103/g.346228 Transcript_111103/m.346228 type:complete len:324 (-) Transcript_111103:82-1053(-)
MSPRGVLQLCPQLRAVALPGGTAAPSQPRCRGRPVQAAAGGQGGRLCFAGRRALGGPLAQDELQESPRARGPAVAIAHGLVCEEGGRLPALLLGAGRRRPAAGALVGLPGGRLGLPPRLAGRRRPGAAAAAGADAGAPGHAFQNKNEEEPVWQVYDHPLLAPQHYRRQGDNRFLLIMNWMIGPYQLVTLSALPNEESLEDPRERQMWRRFLDQPPALRWRRLRVSATCFEGPYIVHELIRSKRPSHVGKFLPSHSLGDGHLEVDIHLTSSEMRRLRVVFQHSSHLIVIGLAYFLMGDGPGEPPERLLFAHYCSLVHMAKLRQV